mgnify:FL=1
MSKSVLQDIEFSDCPSVISESQRLIKVRSRDKRPTESTKGPYYGIGDSELLDHCENGGNLGLVLNDSNDLVVLDSDSVKFSNRVEKLLPETLTVRSGSGGKHYYFRSDYSRNRVLTESGKELGSIRSDNWMVVLPPSVHPNGESYKWCNSAPVADLNTGELDGLISEFTDSEVSQHSGGGGSSAAAAAGLCWSDLDLRSYPDRTLNWSEIKQILTRKGTLRILSKTSSNDWSGQEFLLIKSMAEVGLSEESIRSVMDRLHPSSKWHKRGSSYQNRTIYKATESALEDDYVDFGRIMEYETTDKKLVYQADSVEEVEDGDRAIQIEVVRMTGKGDDGEDVDVNFLSLSKGRFSENGDFGINPEFNGDSKSLGAAEPEDMELIAECLQELAK